MTQNKEKPIFQNFHAFWLSFSGFEGKTGGNQDDRGFSGGGVDDDKTAFQLSVPDFFIHLLSVTQMAWVF